MEVTESLKVATHSGLDFCIRGESSLAVSQLGHGHLINGLKFSSMDAWAVRSLLIELRSFPRS